MKAYTDIEQSKKLAEILPTDSADAYYTVIDQGLFLEVKQGIEPSQEDIPCWSLTALLSVLSDPILTQFSEDKWNVAIFGKDNNFKDECFAGEPIDACYEMIVRLHKKDKKCVSTNY